ncbi:hypothetical protein H5410_058288 [Solanum commersonii]|uniref:Uncharacterized protein n=1 Tax=Solanum commersonii TaxID=4109 RepID=A0A9J5WR90_SOLCO|nr:hypothetical protein H5410_058288 [Solanum commersonii]
MKNAEWKRKLSEDINRGLTKFNLGRGGFGEISGYASLLHLLYIFRVSVRKNKGVVERPNGQDRSPAKASISPWQASPRLKEETLLQVEAAPVLHYMSKKSDSGKGGSTLKQWL